jgi:hypothetical protein
MLILCIACAQLTLTPVHSQSDRSLREPGAPRVPPLPPYLQIVTSPTVPPLSHLQPLLGFHVARVTPPPGFRALGVTAVSSSSLIRSAPPLEILIVATNLIYITFPERADDGSRRSSCPRASSSTMIWFAPPLPDLTNPGSHQAQRHPRHGSSTSASTGGG